MVLAITTAPSEVRRSASGAVSRAGCEAKAARPIVLSVPAMWKVSFREMGRPCRGPRGLPVRRRWSSRLRAWARALVKRGSVRQRVSWWAIAAL